MCYSLLKSRDLESNPGKHSYPFFYHLILGFFCWFGVFISVNCFNSFKKHVTIYSATYFLTKRLLLGSRVQSAFTQVKGYFLYHFRESKGEEGLSVLTRTLLLFSSSCAFLNSCSREQSMSLKSPTSSQFFRKRVGVGV